MPGRKSQFFGVKVGKNPGVYFEWSDCKAQIVGFEEARWKRFATFEQAHSYCFEDQSPSANQGKENIVSSTVIDLPESSKDFGNKPKDIGSVESPIDILDADADSTLKLYNSSPDKRNDPNRYRVNVSPTVKQASSNQKATMRAMMGLSSEVFTVGSGPVTSSTPCASPCPIKRDSSHHIKISDISAILPEIANRNTSSSNNPIKQSEVIDIGDKPNILPCISNSNLPSSSSNGKRKRIQSNKQVKPKPKTETKKLEKLPKEVPGLSFDDLSSDDEIVFIENPLKEFHMSQSTSEEFYRVGSTEEEVAVGIFWDIENVRMPKGLNPAVFISKIREKFVDESPKFCEKHFYVVCDVQQESPTIMKQLFEFHVRIVHVPRLKANSSDNVLRDLMNEFIGYNKYSRLILISGDSDFSHDIHIFRRSKKCDCILIHNQVAKESMIRSANSAYLYTDLIKEDMIEHQKQQQYQQVHHQPHQQPYQQQGQQNQGQHKQRRKKKSVDRNFRQFRYYHKEDFNQHGQHQLQQQLQHQQLQQQQHQLPLYDVATNGNNYAGPSGLNGSLPDFIPLPGHNPNDALSKAYYRKKRKEMLTPRSNAKGPKKK